MNVNDGGEGSEPLMLTEMMVIILLVKVCWRKI